MVMFVRSCVYKNKICIQKSEQKLLLKTYSLIAFNYQYIPINKIFLATLRSNVCPAKCFAVYKKKAATKKCYRHRLIVLKLFSYWV